jgi:hypothetical protein
VAGLDLCHDAQADRLAPLALIPAFIAAGGSPGTALSLLADFVPLGLLAVVSYSAVNYLFMSAVVALESRQTFWPLAREATIDGAPTAAAETGLGFGFAFFVIHEPWALVALLPLLLGVYRAAERLARLRRETAQVLRDLRERHRRAGRLDLQALACPLAEHGAGTSHSEE